MRAIVCAAIFASVAASGVFAEVLMQSIFTVAGTNYVSLVSEADLKTSPAWLETQEQPPLSPRRAMQAAQATVTNLFKDVPTIVDFVSLHPVGRENKWVYLVQFTTMPRGGLDGDSLPIRLVVLMNGEALLPRTDIAPASGGRLLNGTPPGHSPHPGHRAEAENDVACRIVEKLSENDEWVTCTEISIRPNGDYRRRDFGPTKSLRSEKTGHLPRNLLDPLLTSSRQFPEIEGVPEYELGLDDSQTRHPRAVEDVRDYTTAYHAAP
jgi:hypothetical protein